MSTALTIGNFDGVHVGHREILATARRLAEGAPVIAVTFARHPASVLRPGSEPPTVCGLEERIALLRDAGVDEVAVLEPTRELLGLEASAFVRLLVDQHHPVHIVEGPDFCFGKGRGGDNELLANLGPKLGYQITVVPRRRVTLTDGTHVEARSSLARALIAEGRLADAMICLDRPWSMTAPVTRGEQRGRTIGFPTANLDLGAVAGQIMPGYGVYAGHAHTPDGKVYGAAVSVGVKPTFGAAALTIEAHLISLGIDAASGTASAPAPELDLYDQPLKVELHHRVRGQQAFAGVEALVAQITQDVAAVRDWYTG